MCDNKSLGKDTKQDNAFVVEINARKHRVRGRNRREVFNLETKTTKPYDLDLITKSSPAKNPNDTKKGGD